MSPPNDGDPRQDDGDPGPSESAGDRPWTHSPWLWTAVVVGLVVAAWGLSLMVGTDYQDPELGDEDTVAFCGVVAELGSTESFDGSGTGTGEVVARFERLSAAAPASMQQTLDDLERAAASLAVEIEGIEAANSDPIVVAELRQQAVRRFARDNDPELNRYETYVRKACGEGALTIPDDTTASSIAGPTVPGATTTSGG